MVRAWYIDGDALANPRDEHQQLPPKFITLEDLYKITGVEHFSLNPITYSTDGSLAKIKEERGYFHEDVLETPHEDLLKVFYMEHLHQNEEVRFVLEGCGYYDIRDHNDKWIRVEVLKGDLIIIPSGCYHRFMLDHTNNYKAVGLFKEEVKWTSINRPTADDLLCRKNYLNKAQHGVFEQ